VLSAQDRRDSRRESAQDQIFSVHDVPAALDLVGTHALRRGKGSISHLELSTPRTRFVGSAGFAAISSATLFAGSILKSSNRL